MGNFACAWKAFWGILKSDDMAAAWTRCCEKASTTPQLPPTATPPAAAAEGQGALKGTTATGGQNALEDGAVYALALLQREARLVDFLQENLDGYDDAMVGAAVRKVHEDGQRVLRDYFGVAPIRKEEEQSQVEIAEGEFDPKSIRLTGHVSGAAPYRGVLCHRGWRAQQVTLPTRNEAVDPTVIAPAEVEQP